MNEQHRRLDLAALRSGDPWRHLGARADELIGIILLVIVMILFQDLKIRSPARPPSPPCTARLDRRRLERRITAIGPAEDGEALGIGNPLLAEPADAVGDVAHRGAPILDGIVVLARLAHASGAAVLRLDHRIAACAKNWRASRNPNNRERSVRRVA